MHIPDQTIELFRGKYRVPSTRLEGWDYTSPGYYFVTICTKGRVPWFGKIRNGMMGLSEIGCVAAQEWQQTECIRKNVTIDDFIIMPDHIHGIIIIHSVETPCHGVSTSTSKTHHKSQWQKGCLGSIIQQFKRATTVHVREIHDAEFAWQPRFHDRILRDEKALADARMYIQENPRKFENNNENYIN